MKTKSTHKSETHKMSGYTFQHAKAEDDKLILDFLNEHFVPYEPINCAINLCEVGYRMPYFDGWVQGFIEKKDTVVILAKDEKEDLLGMVIIEIEKNRKMPSNSPTSEKPCPRYERCPKKLTKIFNFLDWLKRDLDVQKEYKVEEWGDIMILACRSDIRVPGLGTALVKEGIRVMEDRGFTVFTGTATSHFSGRIFQKLGFHEVSAQSYDEYRVDGEVIFKTTAPHTHARQFVRS